MNLFFWIKPRRQNPFIASSLYDETDFYRAFISDLNREKEEVIIESPYITTKRMDMLYPIFSKLTKKGIKIYEITRDPIEHEGNLRIQAEREIRGFEMLGIQVLICSGKHHRKLAMVDRKVLWEGSLNILSQCYSREIMRRIESEAITRQMFSFLRLGRII